jgi:muramoyltetrapeptide carboxypeptidase
VVAPASPFEAGTFAHGIHELERLGFRVTYGRWLFERDGYFAGTAAQRASDLAEGLTDDRVNAVFCARGGFGSADLLKLLDILSTEILEKPKVILGFSDITVLQSFLWKKTGWVTFYGPMVAAGFHVGADQPGGYDSASFTEAIKGGERKWTMDLGGVALAQGEGEGRILGGCLTMLETTLATRWEIESDDAILLLEDRAMKPYQVERSLLHLGQAGKLDRLRGIILGEFPECDPPTTEGIRVEDIFRRHFGKLGIPVVTGAAFGHTVRPMLTMPLGVRGRIHAESDAPAGTSRTTLEILESACSDIPGGD